MSTKLASFPNSRIKPRAATREATTPQIIVLDVIGGGPTQLVAADPNRTYLTIRNISSTTNMKYAYRKEGFPIPAPADFHFPIFYGETASGLESPQEVWGLSDGPGPVTAELDVGTG